MIFNSYAAFRAATVPVIAVVRGLAAGFGCAIAGVADITIAAESATFQIPEMAHRIMPTMVMSALMDRVSRKDLTYLVVFHARSSAPRGRARPASPARWCRTRELDQFVDALCKRILDTPELATESAKEFLRRAFTMDVAERRRLRPQHPCGDQFVERDAEVAETILFRSSPRKRGPDLRIKIWIPACAGMSGGESVG